MLMASSHPTPTRGPYQTWSSSGPPRANWASGGDCVGAGTAVDVVGEGRSLSKVVAGADASCRLTPTLLQHYRYLRPKRLG